MTEAQQSTTPVFNYAGLDSASDRLACLKLEEGKQALVAFLENIPGMQSPPFVYCKVHWNSEMGENGRLFQCFGGQCCQQITWQKGWGGEPGKFEANKPRTRFYVPVVHYEPDPKNPAVAAATVKYLDMTYSAYDALVKAIQNTTEGLPFFERDITLEATKVNGATVYLINKKESRAQWLTNEVFKQQVAAQLPDVAKRLEAAMPKVITETEFMALKPELDAKVQLSMNSHKAPQQQPQTIQSSVQYGAFPAAQPVAQPTAQPAVNIPVAPVTETIQTITPSTSVETFAEAVPSTTAETNVIPADVQLDFDPDALLK